MMLLFWGLVIASLVLAIRWLLDRNRHARLVTPLEILKSYMERYRPDFAKTYAALREEAIQAIDPEWSGAEPERKQ